MATPGDAVPGKPEDDASKRLRARRLAITFVCLLIVGLANKLFIKLMTFPLYNYPVFVNLMSSFIYIPTSFAYIIPMVMRNKLKAELEVPQLVFLTMGALDAVAGIMQLFATNFIESGSLLILLQQASIPLSMVMSRLSLNTRYSPAQYSGAAIVIFGILYILWPSFKNGGGDDCDSFTCNPVLWSAVLVLSCVPMCLSTVYKERALAKIDIDPIYLNGFVSVYQFIISIPLSIPAAPVTGIAVSEVPQNAYNGWLCYIGYDSVTELTATSVHPPDDCWPTALIFATAYLVFNQLYNILIILMLKFGSANLLYLVMTLLVPLGNIAFALPFMPYAQPLTGTNVGGLAIIMLGLFNYRFLDKILRKRAKQRAREEAEGDNEDRARRAAVVMGSATGTFALEGLQYMIDDSVLRSPTFAQLKRSPAQIRASYFLKLGMHPHHGSGAASPLLPTRTLIVDDVHTGASPGSGHSSPARGEPHGAAQAGANRSVALASGPQPVQQTSLAVDTTSPPVQREAQPRGGAGPDTGSASGAGGARLSGRQRDPPPALPAGRPKPKPKPKPETRTP